MASEMAHALALPLDILSVHKIGAPREPELAIGAVAEDGPVELDEDAIAAMHISEAELQSAIVRERAELLRRERVYRVYCGDRPPLALTGQVVILVDDGLATGYTMLAAIHAVRRRGASRIVIAVPVAPQDTLDRLRYEADDMFCVYTPRSLMAVGQFYEDFSQVRDERVARAVADS